MKSLISTLVNAWRSSIRNQLTLAFATVTSLIMLIFNYNIIQHERDFLMKQSINHTFELARAISVSSSSWLLADDVVGLQEIVLAISNPELRYAMVLSPEGRVMASHDSSLIGHYLADPISRKFLMSTPANLTLIDTKHSLDIVTPITANQQHIGWVRIGLGRDKLNNNLRKVAIYGFFMAFLAITITIAIARWLSGKLTSKLNHVIMVANQVHAGQTNQRVQLEDMSEIGILGKDINRMLDAIQYANQRIELLLDSISDGFYGVDNQGIVTFINPAGAKMLGYEVDEIIGKDAHELIHHTHNDGSDYPSEDCKINASFKHGIRSHVNDEVFWCKDGSSFPVEYYSDPVIEDGNIIGAVVSFNNITQQKQNEELIWHQANYDALTGLPNRRLFQEHLLQETKKAERTHQLLALLLLDIDHFKEVNDTLGHDMGDTLLLEAAQRIKNCIRETDTVARLGGDEFTVILSGVISSNDVDLIAQKILHALARPFQLGNDLSYLSASIGITLYPDDTTSLTTLLKNADQAMYSAKEAGRNRSHYFTSSMQDAMQNKALLVKGLHEAIKKQQFDVYYQPIIQIKTGHIDKAEALIR
ncbi:MAG: diguanylate cyclase [Gammaproteobacteria bacterium]|nr:diguanylate cyclase [Gammaproteobacteria bacterium]